MPNDDNQPFSGGMPIINLGRAARMVENLTAKASQYATAAYDSNLEALADPFMRSASYATSFNRGGTILLGRLIDGSAHTSVYRVQFEHKKMPIWAVNIMATGQAAMGATQLNTYTPGTDVIVYLAHGDNFGYILGAIPWLSDRPGILHDTISNTSRLRVDDCHKRYYQMQDSTMPDCSAWLPLDATQAGEWGAITSTGLKITADDFLVQLAVNEFTGVFGFYHDQLLRISGMAMQCWTGGSERDALVDEGEYSDYQGYSPYYWEHFGAMKPGTDIINEYSAKNMFSPSAQPYYSHWESKEKYQSPFHRTQEYYGYLGQGKRTVLCAPPVETPDIWTLKPGQKRKAEDPFESKTKPAVKGPEQKESYKEKPPIGLHEDNIGQDGRRFIATAKGFTIVKRPLISTPTRIRNATHGEGDRADDNYKPAGQFGEGPDHTITGDLKTGDDFPNMQRAVCVLDLHAYLFNYAGLHPFHWHYKDFKTWEQQELKYAECNQYVPEYSALAAQAYLPEPVLGRGLRELSIDHRYKQQKFFETESIFSMLEDGSIVIGDGYGAQILMSAGSVTISAPGDIWIKSGNSTQLWAGKDCVIRAKQHVDLSATEKDVRVKAENNLMMLGGNNKRGGVMIEGRGEGYEYDFTNQGEKAQFSGVVLRAPQASVVTHARDVYLRSGGAGSDDMATGNITLDAGTGYSDIITKSTSTYHYLQYGGSVSHFYGRVGEHDENTQVANYFSKDATLLSGMLYNKGYVFSGKGVLADGFGFFNGQLVADTDVQRPCDGDCENAIKKAIAELNQLETDKLPKIADKLHAAEVELKFYDEHRAGNDFTMSQMGFSFRTDSDYFSGDNQFVVFEDRWQHMARISNQKLGKWEEKSVTTGGEETYPFPGKAKFTETGAYRVAKLNLVDIDGSKMIDKRRDSGSGKLASAYETPEFGKLEEKTLKDDYIVIQ